MTQSMNPTESGLLNFIKSIDGDLGRDPDSLNVFEWVVEDHFLEKILESREYWSLNPELVAESDLQIRLDLDRILNWFVELEEYEKCQRIVQVKESIHQKLAEMPVT